MAEVVACLTGGRETVGVIPEAMRIDTLKLNREVGRVAVVLGSKAVRLSTRRASNQVDLHPTPRRLMMMASLAEHVPLPTSM